MKIHLSTQGTTYNASGVRAAKKLGFERVVLARDSFASQGSQQIQHYKKAAVNIKFSANLGEYPNLTIIDKCGKWNENTAIQIMVKGSIITEKALNRKLTIEDI